MNYLDVNRKIRRFESVLRNKLKHCNLENFYVNFPNLKIRINSLLLLSSQYDSRNNKLRLSNLNDLEHELFHICSYNQNKKNNFGLSIKTLGNGLNEGYTQLLTRRYFNKSSCAYWVESKIAFNIELIVGKIIF